MFKKITACFFILLLLPCSVNASPMLDWLTGKGTTTTSSPSVYQFNSFVLLYHELTTDNSLRSPYCVTVEQFENDITLLLDNGYLPVLMSEYYRINSLNQQQKVEEINALYDGKKLVMITFDDGYSSMYYELMPILEKYNVKANIFLIGEFIGTDGFLSEEQIREMADSDMVEFGNHTYSIHNMSNADLSRFIRIRENLNSYVEDVKKNDEMLRQITGKNINALAFPYGLLNSELNKKIKDTTGYQLTFSTHYDIIRSFQINTPLNRLNRDGLAGNSEFLNYIHKRMQ